MSVILSLGWPKIDEETDNDRIRFFKRLIKIFGKYVSSMIFYNKQMKLGITSH